MKKIKLRPHHLLCTQSYNGSGYSPAFVEKMDRVVALLRAKPDTPIKLVFSTDDLCLCCPGFIRPGRCKDDAKVQPIDRKTIHYFALREQTYRYGEITETINKQITPQIIDDICGSCGWYLSCGCRDILLDRAAEHK